MRISA
jgi:DNA replication protein DnaC